MATIQTETKFGARELYDHEKLEKAAVTRTGRFVDFLKIRRPDDQRDRRMIMEAILGYSEAEPINLEELEKTAGLFEMDEGFTSYPRPEYPPGAEPATAPLTREQLRLLLISALPPEIIPFVQEKFVFHYNGQEEGGPRVHKEDDKLHITFYRDNFTSEVIPAGYATSPDKKQQLKYLRGFIDPSKVVMVVGKVIAQIMPPPKELEKLLRPDFDITENKERADGLKKKTRQPAERDSNRLAKQWEDFVGLAMAAPDVAAQRYPQLFDHYKDQLKSFDFVNLDSERLDKIDTINWEDFNIMIDLRTQAEKEAAKPLEPQLAWYDQFISFLNRSLVKFGKKIAYQKPLDPTRDAYLAESDKQVKELLLTTNERTRDVAFGQRLQESTDFNSKDRYETFAYLMAYSQAGEFAEWRIYAWLYKFSRLFRQTGGQQIDEQDFKDLTTIYRQSEDMGHRFGTQVLPFEAKAIHDPTFGRPVFVYHAIDRINYKKLVEKKVQSKNDRTVQDVNEEVFHRFYVTLPDGRKEAIPYDAVFDPEEASGLMVSTGSMTEFLGDNMARAVGGYMKRQRVERITADAKAVARTLYGIYLNQGRKFSDRWNEESRELVTRFESELNREAPATLVEKAKGVDVQTVLKTEDADYIAESVKGVAKAEGVVQQTIAVAAKHFNKAPGTPDQATVDRFKTLSTATQDQLHTALKAGEVDPGRLYQQVGSDIDAKIYPSNPELANQEKRNLLAFLTKVRTNLVELDQLKRKREAMEPQYFPAITESAAGLIKDSVILETLLPQPVLDKNSVNDPLIKTLEELKVVSVSDLDKIYEQARAEHNRNTVPPAAAAGSAAGTPPAAETQSIGPPLDLKPVKIAQLEHIKERLESSKKAEGVVSTQLYKAITLLREDLYNAGKGSTHPERFKQWLDSSGRIMRLKPMEGAIHRLTSAINLMDSNNPAVARDGVVQLDQTTADILRAVKYDEAIHKEIKKSDARYED